MTATGDETTRWRATAELFGRLLLIEVDGDMIRELERTGALAELRALGLSLPAADDDQAREELAADHYEALVRPTEEPPPIQSLVEEGVYEGRAAAGMRAVARAAGLDFDADAARGAPVDHLGVQLLLWSELAGRDAAAAAEFARRHLAWAPPHLRRTEADGFHAHLKHRTADLIQEILNTSVRQAAGEDSP